MSSYAISFIRSARKELENLDTQSVKKVFLKIESLSTSPRPMGCEKLQGRNNLWRIRVGDYRIIYIIDDMYKTIEIRRIRHRKDAYR